MNKTHTWRLIIGLIGLTLIYSCKDKNVEAPEFNVDTDKAEYKVGEAVNFKISGDPDVISFYSGEKGKEYQFKDRTTANGKVSLSMTTQVLFGRQPNNLALLYSTDFNGLYDAANVRAATWTDITSRFKLSTVVPGGSGVQTPSGVVDISDLPVAGKPIYFAFKYTGDAVTGTTPTQNTWRVYAFDLTNTLPDGSVLNVSSASTAGWLAIDFVNTANKWTIQTAAPFIFFNPNSTLVASEDWALTKALFPNNVDPDVAAPIKTYLQTVNDYKYTYTTPGTYTVTFVGTNGKNTGSSSVVKQLTIVVK
ncbi:DUF5017 domain-containing protein [Mucilaginibacter sp. PAMB04168]|uniref:DUF5017 domain-containing protein n=1 Tax=Mucilaginibacter sp. PAMB04168 TaxID=3138567 RepID=UPI0031F65822